jgi:hypothetical protein
LFFHQQDFGAEQCVSFSSMEPTGAVLEWDESAEPVEVSLSVSLLE